MKLNQGTIPQLEWSGRSLDIRWCPELKGFGVRVYPTGKKSFVLGYTEGKKYKVRTIAPVDSIPIREARLEARKILAQVERRTLLMQEFGPPVTFESLSRQWLDNYAKLHKQSWKEDERRFIKYIWPEIGSSSLGTITTVRLVRLHSEISKTKPVQANRVMVQIRTVYNAANRWGLWAGMNPANAVKLNHEEPRDRWLTPEEVPQIFIALTKEQNIYAQKAIMLYLLLGQRKNEILKLKWDDVDLQRRLLTIRKTKTKQNYYVSVSSRAQEVLESIPRKPNNPFVICGKRPYSHLVNIRKPWLRVLESAGVVDVTIHDLRRTVGSWLAQQNYSLSVIGQVLNHKNTRSTQRYARFQQKTIADALESHGERLFSVANGEPLV